MGIMVLATLLIPILVSLVVGVFVNYLCDVLPMTRRLTRPVCHSCSRPLGLADYLLNRPCPACGRRPSWRYWAVMGSYLALSLYTWLFPSRPLGYPVGMLLLAWLGAVVVMDLEFHVVLHEVSAVGAVLGVAIGVWSRVVLPTLVGGITGFAIMLVFYGLGVVYSRWLSRRRKPSSNAAAGPQASAEEDDEVALGFGDVNLSGILGFMLGWPAIIAGLLTGILAAGVISLVYILGMVLLKKYRLSMAIPYAPFLVLGAAIYLYGLWAL